MTAAPDGSTVSTSIVVTSPPDHSMENKLIFAHCILPTYVALRVYFFYGSGILSILLLAKLIFCRAKTSFFVQSFRFFSLRTRKRPCLYIQLIFVTSIRSHVNSYYPNINTVQESTSVQCTVRSADFSRRQDPFPVISCLDRKASHDGRLC